MSTVQPHQAAVPLLIGLLLAALGFQTQSEAVGPWFQERAQVVGLSFTHFAAASEAHYLPEIMGPGVALLDYDLDGDLDVYAIQGTWLEPLGERARPASVPGPPVNRLFRNRLKEDGTLRFEDVTSGSGLDHPGYGMGAAVGDYDGDGDPDIYLTNFGENALFQNQGDGSFVDVTTRSRTGDERWSTSASFVDYDRDGDLDLFVLNYIDFTVAANKTCYDAAGALDYCNPNLYRPLPDRLFRNDGGGRFHDVTEQAGLGAAVGPGLGVTCADFNQDGWSDIYVANDGAANFLWINDRQGGFEEEGLMSGSAYNADGAPEGSMGVVAGDFDNDGDEDLFMTHLTQETNTLYINDGRGNFLDATSSSGLGDASLAYTGFGTGALDYDHDGWEDLFMANGAVRNLASLRGQVYPYHQANQLFRNVGGRFEEVSSRAGDAFQQSEVSRGVAVGDIDNDGDVDILIANNNGPVRLLLNQIGSRRPWLGVQLRSTTPNRSGVGARLELLLSKGRVLHRRVRIDGSYLSSNDPRVFWGWPESDGAPEAVTIQWPEGSRERWDRLKSDTLLTLVQGQGEDLPTALESAKPAP